MNDIIKWTNNNQGFLMAVLTLVYVLATLWLVLLARRQLRLASDLEHNRTRPFIIFELVLERHHVFATIRNIGQTPALKIRMSVVPAVECLVGAIGSPEIAFIARGVEMLPPQRSITALLGHWNSVKSAHPKLLFEGSITYNSPNEVSYKEFFVADLSAHDGLLYLGTNSVHDVAKQLEEIANTLVRLATGFAKPLIRTIAETEYRAEERAFVDEARDRYEQRENETPTSPSKA